MRASLQSAGLTEKALAAAESELTDLKSHLAKAREVETHAADLAEKVTLLENELVAVSETEWLILVSQLRAFQLKQVTSTHLINGLPASSPATARESKTRLSSGSALDDPEKKLRGFQHIIQELSAENAELKEKYTSVMEEIELLKEVTLFGQNL